MAFVFVLFVVILLLILSMKRDLVKKLEELEAEIRILQDFAGEQESRKTRTVVSVEPEPAPVIVPPATPAPARPAAPVPEEYWESGFKVVDAPSVPGPVQEPVAAMEAADLQERISAMSLRVEEPVLHPPSASIHTKTPQPGFFERNPDLEKFIGENLVSKIGIGILVLAIAYFVKYAIDNNWIGPVGRVGVGMLCGGILVAVAHAMRSSYKAFSSVLVGGGIAIFYFTIALAFHQFQLFSQTAAFIIMVIITGFAVALSLLYDRQELAIIAMIGGFATPFMVSDGSGNYVTLFIYLIILNAGLLVMAYFKAWRLLNLLAFIFTLLLFWGWLANLADATTSNVYRNAFLFATIFYLFYFVINIAHNVREHKKFIASDFGIILSNTCVYFSAGLYCLYQMHAAGYKGLFSIALAIFNLAVTYAFFKNRKIDTNLLYLLIGITLTFLSLTAPLQLEGNFITLFWAAESVLLLWLFQKSKIRIVETAFLLVWVVMLFSLLLDWINIYQSHTKNLPIIFNKGFITTLFASVATFAISRLMRTSAITDPGALRFGRVIPTAITFRYLALVLLFIAGLFEINHHFNYYYPGTGVYLLYLEFYTSLFVLVFTTLERRERSLKPDQHSSRFLLVGCIIIYLLLISANFNVQLSVFGGRLPAVHFNVTHWLMVAATLMVLYRVAQLLSKTITRTKEPALGIWLLSGVGVLLASVEVNHLIRTWFYNGPASLPDIERVFVKTILPILWGLCSFGFMWLGMKYKVRPLRIFSLTLFLLTLCKLFLFDIRNIPVAGKIAAFFCLGVLLLIVSFMYQRLKKIIIQNEEKPVG
ncbi:DUF2339 domain-containing protein [Segetibacter sp. 3557_3]|uniref:DUF2339 domain-containing protein n=1 Tax=Segetibacter sp. 3557_3 TaxID=2547429 RepID=UPI0010591DE4|nr:DUF2339 domain-containing protein [Segetibacter sp. 3557_3]TDH20866.1 DUF2339 domain-containing protein [Segetibacter sp. 3557_3]